jgi:hypothetical protein
MGSWCQPGTHGVPRKGGVMIHRRAWSAGVRGATGKFDALVPSTWTTGVG